MTTEAKSVIVIDRSKWLRGEDDSCLLRSSDRKMCCVGQYLEQIGVPRQGLQSRCDASANAVEPLVPERGQWLLERQPGGWVINSNCATSIYATNDGGYYYDAFREAKLTALFAEAGETVIFVDNREAEVAR